MNVQEISTDGVEPVTLAQAKQQCYIPTTDTDTTMETLLTSFIEGARKYAEGRTWRSLVDKTLELRMDDFPYNSMQDNSQKVRRDIIELPYGPVVSVTSIKYLINGVETTLSADSYTVDTNSTPARIEPVDFWPGVDDIIDAVRIRYTTGYVDSGGNSNAPEDIKIALRMMIKFLYDNRDSYVLTERSGEYLEAPIGTNLILDTHSIRKFA